MPDRTHNYVPTGLYLDGNPQYTEIGRARDPWTDRETVHDFIGSAYQVIKALTADASNPDALVVAAQWLNGYELRTERDDLTEPAAPAPTGRIAHGNADELNRSQGEWWWADVSGNGTHWSYFRGHRIQVDVTLTTWNERDVNDWKGRDEIRACGEWNLSLNRQPIYSGNIGSDPLAALRRIDGIAQRLMDHPALHWYSDTPIADQLLGRKVYYERTPAIVSYVSTLDQGAIGLKPVGVEAFPPSVHQFDEGDDGDVYERREIKVDLLESPIWWWRDRLVEGFETEAAA